MGFLKTKKNEGQVGVYMKKAALNVKIDPQLKEEFSRWCDSVVMNPSVAVNIFVKEVVRGGKMPFVITSGDPFYNEANITHLKRGIKELNSGGGDEGK